MLVKRNVRLWAIGVMLGAVGITGAGTAAAVIDFGIAEDAGSEFVNARETAVTFNL